MKKTLISLLSILSIAGLGCGSSGGSTKSDAGGGGGGLVLMPDPNGFMDGSVAGVTGAWYSYGDSYNTSNPNNEGDCQKAGYSVSQCSSATSPAFGAPFTNTDGKMCLTGTAAVVPDSTAYSAIWGLGLGFDFNNAGIGDAGASAGNGDKLPWNGTMDGITGFKFTISGVPIGGNMRVEFPFMGEDPNNAPYWGGTGNLSPLMSDGTYSFKWADVSGPSYDSAAPKFDPTMIISAQFHVVTNLTGPIAVNNLCVSNVTLTTD